jgi:hypothetical protein
MPWRRQKFPDARVGVVFQMAVGRHEARGKLGAVQAERRQTLLAKAQIEQQVGIEVRNAATDARNGWRPNASRTSRTGRR